MIDRVRIKPKPPKPPKPSKLKKRKVGTTILEACDDTQLFGEAFKNPASWSAWRSFLASLFGLPLTKDQLNIFKECTGRDHPPINGTNEAWLICGRRGGKSFTLAVIAVYLAAFKDWRRYLQRGEKATIMVIAVNRRQAQVILRFIIGLLTGSELLKNMIEAQAGHHFGKYLL